MLLQYMMNKQTNKFIESTGAIPRRFYISKNLFCITRIAFPSSNSSTYNLHHWIPYYILDAMVYAPIDKLIKGLETHADHVILLMLNTGRAA